MVTIDFPATSATGVWQEKARFPSTKTLHAPHSPSPHPKCVRADADLRAKLPAAAASIGENRLAFSVNTQGDARIHAALGIGIGPIRLPLRTIVGNRIWGNVFYRPPGSPLERLIWSASRPDCCLRFNCILRRLRRRISRPVGLMLGPNSHPLPPEAQCRRW